MTEISASSTDANRTLIRQVFEAWQQGTGAITDVFAPDMIWRIEGHSVASKEYSSKQEFVAQVLRLRRPIHQIGPLPPDHHPVGPRRRRHGDRPLGWPRHRP